MEQKPKRRRRWIIIGVIALVAVLVIALAANLPKQQQLSDASYDLAALEDGTYEGECANGLVFAKVEVQVRDHAIENVRLLEHRTGKGKPGEGIVEDVKKRQSVEVDAVSGATMSSQTILKAVENALRK